MRKYTMVLVNNKHKQLLNSNNGIKQRSWGKNVELCNRE